MGLPSGIQMLRLSVDISRLGIVSLRCNFERDSIHMAHTVVDVDRDNFAIGLYRLPESRR
jgi:hypothetical protein